MRKKPKHFVRYYYYDELPIDAESVLDDYLQATKGNPGERVLFVFTGDTIVCVCFGEDSYANARRSLLKTKIFNVSEINRSTYKQRNPEQFRVQSGTPRETLESQQPPKSYLSQFLKRSPKEKD